MDEDKKGPSFHDNPLIEEVGFGKSIKKVFRKSYSLPKDAPKPLKAKKGIIASIFQFVVIGVIVGTSLWNKYLDKREFQNLQKARKSKQVINKANRSSRKYLIGHQVDLDKKAQLQAKSLGAKYVGDGRRWDPDTVDRQGRFHIAPEGGNSIPNNADLQMVYRNIYECKSKKLVRKVVIYLHRGYSDYTGGDRYDELCEFGKTYFVESFTP